LPQACRSNTAYGDLTRPDARAVRDTGGYNALRPDRDVAFYKCGLEAQAQGLGLYAQKTLVKGVECVVLILDRGLLCLHLVYRGLIDLPHLVKDTLKLKAGTHAKGCYSACHDRTSITGRP
jgi:hypothetical protein